jgi:hypothetical protein
VRIALIRGWHRVSGVIFLALLLACAGPEATGTPSPTPIPTLQPTALPAPTVASVADVAASAIIEPTATPPSPTETPVPPTPTPPSDPPDAIFRGGLERTGSYDDEGVASFNRLKWRFMAEGAEIHPNLRRFSLYRIGKVQSSPAIHDGVTFVGSDDFHLYAVDLETGEKKWRFLARPVVVQPAGPVQSSPAVDNGTVFFGTIANHLYAVDTETGEEKWKFRTGSAVLSSPAIVDNTVYFGSWDGYVYAVKGGEKLYQQGGAKLYH